MVGDGSVTADALFGASAVQQRQYERNYRRGNPEECDGSEIIMLDAVRGDGNVLVYKPSGRHVLNSRCDVACNPHDSQRSAGSLPGHDVHGHQPSEEADQYADGYSEQHHREDVHPHGITAVKEQRQRHGVQYAEYQCGNLAVAPEKPVRKPSRKHRSENSQEGVYRDDGDCLDVRESFGLLQEQYAPSVDCITGYVHECACRGKHPDGRGPEDLLLNLPDGLFAAGHGFLVGKSLYGRQTLGFGGIVEPAEDDENASNEDKATNPPTEQENGENGANTEPDKATEEQQEDKVIIPQGKMKVTVICDGSLNIRRSAAWGNENICGRAIRGQSYYVKEIHVVDGKKMVRTIGDLYLSGESEHVQFEQL